MDLKQSKGKAGVEASLLGLRHQDKACNILNDLVKWFN